MHVDASVIDVESNCKKIQFLKHIAWTHVDISEMDVETDLNKCDECGMKFK